MLALAACSGERTSESDGPRPVRSALLVTLDTTRYDALGIHGAPEGVTPALDALAEESLVFDACRTVAPLTLPSHASMLTGMYPPRHGIRDNGYAALPEAVPTLAEHARAAGLRTGAFVAAVVLDRRFRLDRGFETYTQPERTGGQATHAYTERSADEVVDDALGWLQQLTDADDFLAWVHLFDPHAPYAPPAELTRRAGGDPYLGEVALADRAVGRLLSALRDCGRLESTLVLVTADHGEDRMQHGEPSHASFCYDTTIRVPLLVRFPDGFRAGERSDAIASVVDVFPTVLRALGVDDLPESDGVDLVRPPTERGVYFETYYNFINYGWSPLAGWADAAGKYIHSPSPELFRTDRDPDERVNLAPSTDPAELERYRAAIGTIEAIPHAAARLSERDQAMTEMLQDLGYAGGDAPPELPAPLDDTGLPAPVDRVGELHAFLEASELSDLGRCDDALPLFERVVTENPNNRIALDRYAYCLIQAKDWARAAEVLGRRVEVGEAVAATHINLGVCLQNLSRPEEALTQYRHALELDPGSAPARTNLARLLAKLGRNDEAARVRADGPK